MCEVAVNAAMKSGLKALHGISLGLRLSKVAVNAAMKSGLKVQIAAYSLTAKLGSSECRDEKRTESVLQ